MAEMGAFEPPDRDDDLFIDAVISPLISSEQIGVLLQGLTVRWRLGCRTRR